MATPTPVEKWTLSADNYVDAQKSIMVEVHTSTIYIDLDAHGDGYVWTSLSPEQARALGTMLLYAAEQVAPSGD